MTSSPARRLARALGLAALAAGLSAHGAVAPNSNLPAGWSVAAPAADPALARLTEVQLIDRLQDSAPLSTRGRSEPVKSSFWALSGVVNLGAGSIGVPVQSPAAVELVRRGRRALQALLDHLTDARPTKLVYVVATNKEAPQFDDQYDPRVRGTTPANVNTSARAPLPAGGTYTFKVGDLCYATLGQIVNRQLRPVKCRAEDAMMFSGSFSSNPGDWFETINSPVERPALAAAARADWSGLEPAQQAALLRDDIPHALDKQHPWDPGALARLLYYYPDAGTATAEAMLRRRLVEPPASEKWDAPLPAGQARSWEQEQLLDAIEPFRADRLQVATLALFRDVAADAAAHLKLLPPKTWDPGIASLRSALVLACANRLLHQGHDTELKAFFAARAAALEAADPAPNPGPGRDTSTIRFVNMIQAQECRAFLATLAAPAAGKASRAEPETPASNTRVTVRLGPVNVLQRAPLVLTVAPVDPAPERVFLGRVIIDEARDDTGVSLWADYTPQLAPVAVGRTSDDELRGLPKASLSATLSRPSPQAKSLVTLAGRVELVVPDLDPNAVVRVANLAQKLGTPLDSPALRAAEVSITLHDQKTAASGGVLRTGPIFGEEARLINDRLPTPQLEAGEVALSISDPQERFLNVEFRDASGLSLRYNHNGRGHYASGTTRFDVYHLGDRIPEGAQVVIWLRTTKAFVIAPLRATQVPLPPATATP